MSTVLAFYRPGQDRITRIEYMLVVVGRSGARQYRRALLTSQELAALESLLLKRREAGDIQDFSFESMVSYGFAHLAVWVESFKTAEQSGFFGEPEQETKPAGGGLFRGGL